MVGLVLAGMALGPHGTGALASKEIALSALGEFGLLYLMFSAGLELDLKLFMKMKKAAITFALLSFAIPFTLGIVSARLLDYRWAAAVLMGSNWGSHTLVTYPLLRQMGLARNRAVATVVGATAVTDTSALLVLSVISGTRHAGRRPRSAAPGDRRRSRRARRLVAAGAPASWRAGSSPTWGPTARIGSSSASRHFWSAR